MYYRGENNFKLFANENFQIDAQIAILVFDITNKYSFESLKKWVSQLKENGPKDLSKFWDWFF